MTEKNRSRLRALDDTSKLLALVQLPGKLLDLAERQQKPRRAALLAQMAVAIEVLLMAPLRISNLANLDIELHLVRPNRASRNLHIVIPENEVKNGEPLEYPLPPESVVLIERYLARHRPALASPACTALFPGRSAAKSISTLRQQLIRTVYAHTGLKVHPHLFRQPRRVRGGTQAAGT